jgi:hypothetical protein
MSKIINGLTVDDQSDQRRRWRQVLCHLTGATSPISAVTVALSTRVASRIALARRNATMKNCFTVEETIAGYRHPALCASPSLPLMVALLMVALLMAAFRESEWDAP